MFIWLWFVVVLRPPLVNTTCCVLLYSTLTLIWLLTCSNPMIIYDCAFHLAFFRSFNQCRYVKSSTEILAYDCMKVWLYIVYSSLTTNNFELFLRTSISTPPTKWVLLTKKRLIKLFELCCVCMRSFSINSRTLATLLIADQNCLWWTSQPYANKFPADNLQHAADVLFTGLSYSEVSKVSFIADESFHI